MYYTDIENNTKSTGSESSYHHCFPQLLHTIIRWLVYCVISPFFKLQALYIITTESSQFCSNWAQVLLARGTSSPDPFFLKQAVENYKLKVSSHFHNQTRCHFKSSVQLVQDLNAFKRHLREAESDYHALYRLVLKYILFLDTTHCIYYI